MNFFGTKRTSAPPKSSGGGGKGGGNDPTATIVQLRESMVTLSKREEHIQKKADNAVETAKKKLQAKDKKGALFCMKQKKMYESEVEKIMNSKMTLETQIMSLETQIQNIETYKAMQAGRNAMQQVRKGVDVDNVDDLMDDIKDEMQQAEEIGQAMAQPVDNLDYDEDELLNELNGLEELDLEEKMLSPAAELQLPDAPLPNAPTGQLVSEETEDEAALRELEAELAM